MSPDTKIYVAGHRGMVGAAVVRRLQAEGCEQILTAGRDELDLLDQASVDRYFELQRPDVAVIAAAKVGGILANNTYPADFIYQNLAIAQHTVQAAYKHGVKRLLFLGSSCIYPREAPQPMPEDCLLTGSLEKTNEAYAIAKIAGLKLCQFFRQQYGVLFHSAMPTNLYGPSDNYHPKNSHVLPALIRRFHEAKECGAPKVTLWGTGTPKREFLHVDDCADGIVFLLKADNPPDWVNLGTGKDVTIAEVASTIKEVMGFEGGIDYDTSKPDGTPRKLMDVSKMEQLGWKAKLSLREGIEKAYASFKQELADGTFREV
ncbi:MAG: GDP-L-fucose synthase family protein [Verrucomicrobiota bacterium]